MSHRTATTIQQKQVVVVGLGNILLKDEGIGVYVIQNIDTLSLNGAQDYLLIDGGTCPDVFSHLPKGISTLIVVDAVKGGEKAGTIYRFTPDDIEFKRIPFKTVHQMGLMEGLGIMKLLGRYPKRVIILGVEPKEIDWGLEISPELEEIVHQVILLLKQEFASQDTPDHAAAAGNKNHISAGPDLKEAIPMESNCSVDL